LADDLALTEWFPVMPERFAGYTAPIETWDWESPLLDRDAVGFWELRRLAAGIFRLTIVPRYVRHFRNGPYDADAPRRALARHRAIVRARRDAAFQKFFASLVRTTTA
jgi:hypothetical protein